MNQLLEMNGILDQLKSRRIRGKTKLIQNRSEGALRRGKREAQRGTEHKSI